MEIGLFFGTFNPIHNGHLLIAKSVIDQLKLDQIWFVLSPLSPFKNNDELLDKNIRADLINIALYKEKKMLLCKEEFEMKIPNYTVDTLDLLKPLKTSIYRGLFLLGSFLYFFKVISVYIFYF